VEYIAVVTLNLILGIDEYSLVCVYNFVSLINFVAGSYGCKQMRQGLMTIWGAVIWFLWQHRNLIGF
jgi:hypothetical protein